MDKKLFLDYDMMGHEVASALRQELRQVASKADTDRVKAARQLSAVRVQLDNARIKERRNQNNQECVELRGALEYIEGENNDLVEQLDELTAEHEKLKAKEQESQVAKVELQKKFSTLAFELEQKLKLSGEALAENQIEMQQMQATVGQNIMTITSQVIQKEMELLKMKAESQQLKEGDEKKLAEKSQELEESEARSASLTKTNAKLIEALKDVHMRNVALQRHYEARTERAEEKLLELQPLLEEFKAEVAQQQFHIRKLEVQHQLNVSAKAEWEGDEKAPACSSEDQESAAEADSSQSLTSSSKQPPLKRTSSAEVVMHMELPTAKQARREVFDESEEEEEEEEEEGEESF